jgi:hypothetical protein
MRLYRHKVKTLQLDSVKISYKLIRFGLCSLLAKPQPVRTFPLARVTAPDSAQADRSFLPYFCSVYCTLLWLKGFILETIMRFVSQFTRRSGFDGIFYNVRGWNEPHNVLLSVRSPSNDLFDEFCSGLWVNPYCVLMHFWNTRTW